MINKAVLTEVLETVSGIPVVWSKDPLPLAAPSVAYVSVRSSISLGDDEFRPEVNEDTGSLFYTQSGIRLFTLSVRIECFDPDPEAYSIAEIMRMRLDRPQIREKLLEADMIVTDTLSCTDVPLAYDDRMVSCAAIDFRVMAVINDDFNEPGGTGWIERAETSGEYGD